MRRRWSWTIYGVVTTLVLLAMLWNSVLVLRLEQAEQQARSDVSHQEAVRLALWRMDSWISPQLARESARPFFDYQPFYPRQRAYTKLLYRIEPGEVLTPSPLLSFDSDLFPLHFERGPTGRLTSPQAPRGNLRDLAEDTYISSEQIEANNHVLERIDGLLGSRTDLESCVLQVETQVTRPTPEVDPPPLQDRLARAEQQRVQSRLNRAEWGRRQQTYLQNALDQHQPKTPQFSNEVDDGKDMSVVVGPLIPLWTDDRDLADPGDIIFVRRVRMQQQAHIQGFLCDWPSLRQGLLQQVSDLFPDAVLRPVPTDTPPLAAGESVMATIPVALVTGQPATPTPSLLSPARKTLAVTWLVVLAGVVVVGITLRANIQFGERRSRFASAVTHELRTPLTTFRMYTEMLAEGMVPDENKRLAYLRTLHDESGRLTTLVENVLSYARLEDGRRSAHRERITVEDLLQRLTPPLQRRAEDCDLALRITCHASMDLQVQTDVDAVGQILFNLVDNACKYAPDAEDRTIDLGVIRERDTLRFEVRDHGPGVPPEQTRSIFLAFDRGAHENDSTPGIGLGLALARELADDLDGDLALVDTDGPGACFRLTLPA